MGYRVRKAGADFNPRSPHGERPGFKALNVSKFIFQPTLPARGATGLAKFAPGFVFHFNPRSPHGERRCTRF